MTGRIDEELTEYILGSENIDSAESCLREIYSFRQKKIVERLSDQNPEQEQKLTNISSKLKNSSVQPSGSMTKIFQDATKNMISGWEKNDISERSYAEGLLEWMKLQAEYVIPTENLQRLTDALNEKSRQLLQSEIFQYDESKNMVKDDSSFGTGFSFNLEQFKIRTKVAANEQAEKKRRKKEGTKKKIIDEYEDLISGSVNEADLAEISEFSDATEVDDDVSVVKRVGKRRRRKIAKLGSELDESLKSNIVSLLFVQQLAASTLKDLNENESQLERHVLDLYYEAGHQPFLLDDDFFEVLPAPYPFLMLAKGIDLTGSTEYVAYLVFRIFLLDWIENFVSSTNYPELFYPKLIRDGVKDEAALGFKEGTIRYQPNVSGNYDIIIPEYIDLREDILWLAAMYLSAYMTEEPGKPQKTVTIIGMPGREPINLGPFTTISAVKNYILENICGQILVNEQLCNSLAKLFKQSQSTSQELAIEETVENISRVGIKIYNASAHTKCFDNVDFETLCQQSKITSESYCGLGLDESANAKLLKLVPEFGDKEELAEYLSYISVFRQDSHEGRFLARDKGRKKLTIGGQKPNSILLVAVKDRFDDLLKFQISTGGATGYYTIDQGGYYTAGELAAQIQEVVNRDSQIQMQITVTTYDIGKCPYKGFQISSDNLENFIIRGLEKIGFDCDETENNVHRTIEKLVTFTQTEGFLLASKGSVYFPEDSGIFIQDSQGNQVVSSEELASSISLTTLCKKTSVANDMLDSWLYTTLIEEIDTSTRKYNDFKKAKYIFYDLRKTLYLKEGSTMNNNWDIYQTNSTEDFRKMEKMGFKISFPQYLKKSGDVLVPSLSPPPSDMNSKFVDAYELNYAAAKDNKILENGPNEVDGNMWIGLMIKPHEFET